MWTFLAEITHTGTNLTLSRFTPAVGLLPPSYIHIIMYDPPTTRELTLNMSILPGSYHICCRGREPFHFSALFLHTSSLKAR